MNNIIADSTNEMYRWFDILNEKYFNMKQKVANKTSFRYACPGCGMKGRAKSGYSIMCGACQLELNMEE